MKDKDDEREKPEERRKDVRSAWDYFATLGTGSASKTKKLMSVEARKRREEAAGA